MSKKETEEKGKKAKKKEKVLRVVWHTLLVFTSHSRRDVHPLMDLLSNKWA